MGAVVARGEVSGEMIGHVLWVIGVALALAVAAVGVLALLERRRPVDPRSGWPTVAVQSVWFEDARSGARFVPAAHEGRIVVGAAGDFRVPGTRDRHATVRVFSRHSADIAPLDGALAVAGRRARAPVSLEEGTRVRLGGVELVAHVGWLPEPGDPRIGTFVAGQLLCERLSPRRYACAGGVAVELLEPSVDAGAYELRVRAAERLVPLLLRVRTIVPEAIVVDDVAGAPHEGPLRPAEFVELCRALAPLHAAGIGHGALAEAVFVAPGRVRLWPVAAVGDVPGDIQALRELLPFGCAEPEADDLRSLLLAALRHGTEVETFRWDPPPCERCGERFVRRAQDTTMFDGRDASGRAFGGRTTEHRSECLACGHTDVRIEREAYR